MLHIILTLIILIVAISALIWWKKNSPEDFKFYAVYVSIIAVLYSTVQILFFISSE